MSENRDIERPMDRPHATVEPIPRDEPTTRGQIREEPSTTRQIRDEPNGPSPMRDEPNAPAQMEMWSDMGEFKQRFEAIQSEFIEDPKTAVKKAEHLMEEAIERITKDMRERMQSMHRNVEGKDGDTETLRQAMRGYRIWIDSMGNRRAA